MDENRPSTTCYLAETFEPRNTATGRRAEVELIRRAVERLGLAGVSVRHLRSLYIADEETALHLFEAEEPTAVAQALHGAGLEADRIGPVIEMADGCEAANFTSSRRGGAQPRGR